MVILKEQNDIDLNDLSTLLSHMRIEKINIFSIDNRLNMETITYANFNKGCEVKYTEMNSVNFTYFLNGEDNFLDYNRDSLYILRNGNYLDIKNIFSIINRRKINLGRGGSQKAHALSPLDLRLSSYLMAMFNFDLKLINYLNTFNEMPKNRYLSYKNIPKRNI
jgi:hypothetical protein